MRLGQTISPCPGRVGERIRGVDHECFGEELASLRAEQDALKSKLRPGAALGLIELNAATPGVVYQAKSTGIVTVYPGGGGVTSSDTSIRTGTSLDPDGWTLVCDGDGCRT